MGSQEMESVEFENYGVEKGQCAAIPCACA